MSCTGNCNQGRACTCCTRNSDDPCPDNGPWDWIDEIGYAVAWIALGGVGTASLLLMAGYWK